MPNIMAGSLGGAFPELSTRKLDVMSVVINNACNLSCNHCYLEAPRYEERHLDHDEWMEFFTSVFEYIAPSVLCFAGKEPFLNEKSAELVTETVRLRNRLQSQGDGQTRIGAITNGTLLHQHKGLLKERAPDHFDISIDGLPDEHDHVRGEGAFDQLRPNLEWLTSQFPEQVWVTHTLLASNVDSFPEFIQFYHDTFGLKNFSIGFYKPLSYTDQKLKLWRQQHLHFVESVLPQLGDVTLSEPTEVVLELDGSHQDLIDLFSEAGWLQSSEPISSEVHTFENGLTLRINKVSIPIGLWRSVRVTPEGYWVAAEDLVKAKRYDDLAVASVREHDYDASELYEAGLRSDRFVELLDSSEALKQTYHHS